MTDVLAERAKNIHAHDLVGYAMAALDCTFPVAAEACNRLNDAGFSNENSLKFFAALLNVKGKPAQVLYGVELSTRNNKIEFLVFEHGIPGDTRVESFEDALSLLRSLEVRRNHRCLEEMVSDKVKPLFIPKVVGGDNGAA